MLPASQLGVSRNGLLAAVLGLAWSATSLAQPASRAWVLDSGWNAVVALDPATGRRLATLTVKSRPEGLLLSPDGARGEAAATASALRARRFSRGLRPRTGP